MQNGEITTSTNTSLLSKKDLPLSARKAHLFPGIIKAMLSIGTFCDHGCHAILYNKKLLILKKGSGKVTIKGKRYPHSNLYILNLTQRNKLMKEFPSSDEYFAGSVYECKSKGTHVDYHHASCWIPTKSGWLKAITKQLFTSWPGLSSDLVQKYLPKKQSTILGHLQQPRKGLRST